MREFKIILCVLTANLIIWHYFLPAQFIIEVTYPDGRTRLIESGYFGQRVTYGNNVAKLPGNLCTSYGVPREVPIRYMSQFNAYSREIMNRSADEELFYEEGIVVEMQNPFGTYQMAIDCNTTNEWELSFLRSFALASSKYYDSGWNSVPSGMSGPPC